VTFSEFSKPTQTVQAEQVEEDAEPRAVITPNGAVTAFPGDWEVRYPDGNVRKMTDEEFQSEYGSDAPTSADEDEGETGSDDSGNTGHSVDAILEEDNGSQDEAETTEETDADEAPGREEHTGDDTAPEDDAIPAPPPPVQPVRRGTR
jgi:hypothetical protein